MMARTPTDDLVKLDVRTVAGPYYTDNIQNRGRKRPMLQLPRR